MLPVRMEDFRSHACTAANHRALIGTEQVLPKRMLETICIGNETGERKEGIN